MTTHADVYLQIPVHKDQASPSSLKRKADGEEGAPEAKRQVTTFSLESYVEG